MSEDDRKEEEQDAQEDLELSDENAADVAGGHLKITSDSKISSSDKW